MCNSVNACTGTNVGLARSFYCRDGRYHVREERA